MSRNKGSRNLSEGPQFIARSGNGKEPKKDPLTRRGMPAARQPSPHHSISKATMQAVVFHCRRTSHLCYTSHVTAQSQTRVKLNRVFFPRYWCQARSLGCGFARTAIGRELGDPKSEINFEEWTIDAFFGASSVRRLDEREVGQNSDVRIRGFSGSAKRPRRL